MVPFFGWAAIIITTYLAGCDWVGGDTPKYDSDACWTPASERDDHPPLPGGFPVSPPRPPLKRRARRQHGSCKRLKVSADTYRSESPVSKKTRKEGRNKCKSSAKAFEEQPAKVHLPYRSVSPTPVSHGSTSPTSTEDNGLGVQVIQRTAASTTNPSPYTVTYSAGSQPLSLIVDNVVIGRKRPAPAEFDEGVALPHPKKYITDWMSEYIRLRASSWRKMLRVMQGAKWRPFRPQVIRYLAPAPPSAPLCHGYANPITSDLLAVAPTATHWSETPSPSPPLPSSDVDGPFPSPPFTTTPPYSPPDSPLPFTPLPSLYPEVEAVTPPGTPPPSSVGYFLSWSVQDPIESSHPASRISWADKGKWRVDTSLEQTASRLGQISQEDPIPVATDPFPPLPPSSTSSVPSLTPSPLALPPSPSPQARTHLTSPLPCSLVFPPSPLPLPHPLALPSPPSFSRHLPPLPSYAPHPVFERIDARLPLVSTPKRFEAIKRGRRFKSVRSNPYKMGYLRLRSGVKWHLKDLGFKRRPAPRPPSLPPAISTQPDQIYPVLTMIGPIPAWLWPASVLNPAPSGYVVLTPWRNDWDDGTRISVLAGERGFIPDDPMEGIE